MSATDGFAPRVSLHIATRWRRLLQVAADIGRGILDERAARNTMLRQRAMRMLADETEYAEFRDWAERMLCGMTDQTPEQFMEGRRSRRERETPGLAITIGFLLPRL